MLIIITTDSSGYADAQSMWKEINSLPEGRIYHRCIDMDIDGKDHFFSDKPITDEQIAENYDG